MNLLENFPTICMFLSFFVSSCVFSYFSGIWKILAAVISVICLFVSLINPRKFLGSKSRKSVILSLAALILSCAVSYCAFDIYAAGMEKYVGKRDYFRFRINECYSSLSYGSRYRASIVESSLLPKGTQVILETSVGQLERGSFVDGEAECLSLEGYLGSFDAKSYYNPKNIMLVCSGDDLTYKGADDSFVISDIFAALNEKLTAMIDAHTDSEAGGLVSAVLLGNRNGLYESVKRDFRRLGISHLLVVSGTHFAVVITMLENYMRKLKIKRKAGCVINIAAVFFFMALTGMTPSVVRAGIMHIIAQLSILFSRKSNTLNSFALSGCIIVLFNPLAAGDCGLQLSFAATYSCIISALLGKELLGKIKQYLTSRIPHMKKVVSGIVSLISTVFMTCFVNLSLLPLLWIYFGEISLLSLPANLVFIPLVSVLMYIGWAYLLLYPIKLFVVPIAFIMNRFCLAISTAAGFFARFDLAVIPINYSFALFFLIPLTAFILVLPFVKKKRRIKLCISALMCFVMFVSVIFAVQLYEKGENYLVYSAEKKNEGFVLKSDGKLLLTEISDGSYSFAYNLLDDMEALHCTEIEALLINHYHNKHVRFVGRLCDRETVRSIILTEPINEKEESVYYSLIDLAEEKGIDVYVCGTGEDISFGRSTVVCEREYVKRSTHPITSIKIKADDTTAYIASCSFNEMKNSNAIGDAESADVLILGRHSPVYKKAFGLSFENKPKTLIVSYNAYEYADDDTKSYIDENGEVVTNDTETVYKLSVRLSDN